MSERLKMLLEGKAGRLIGGLKQRLTKRQLSNAKKYTLSQIIGYVERNRKHMRYEIWLKCGYPIGRGVIEGACRNLINDKLELAGMSWKLQGAESVMPLQAMLINNDWDAFWKHRRRAEKKHLYNSGDHASTEIRDRELRQAAQILTKLWMIERTA